MWYFYIVYDASSKLPDGISVGNTHPRGNFHECLDVESPEYLKYKNDYIEGFRY